MAAGVELHSFHLMAEMGSMGPDSGGPPAGDTASMPTFPISQKQEAFGGEMGEEIRASFTPLNQNHLPQCSGKEKQKDSFSPFLRVATWGRDAPR